MAEAARVMEGDLKVVEVAQQMTSVWYQMLMRIQDVLCHYQNDCSVFLDWQMT